MKLFVIKSSGGIEYNMNIIPSGRSYAVPVVYKRKKRFGLFPYWAPVWTGDAKDIITATKMFPESKERWCIETLDDYEAYEKAWRDYEQTRPKHAKTESK